MNIIKKYWYIISLLVITLGLGVVTYLTSQKLSQTGPVAPNVPQEKPKAVSAACTIQFTIAKMTCNTTCKTNADCSTGFCYQPPMPTCPAGSSCAQVMPPKMCRNETCAEDTDCLCNATPTQTPTVTPTGIITVTQTPTNTPVPTNTPTNTPVPTNTPTITPVPTNSPTPKVGCNVACSSDTDCASGFICSTSGTCRNASCTDRTNCVCVIATGTPTPTLSTLAGVTPTDVPLPQTPVSGSPAIFGMSVAAAGIVLLLLGLVF